MSGTADRGSGLLPPDPDSVVLGFNIPFAMKQYYLIPFFQPPPSFSFHFLCIPLSPGGVFWAATVMVIAGKMTIDDSIEAVENFSLDDFSIQITPDTAAAKNTLETSIVGRFFSKRDYSTTTMRKVLSGMWRLQRGWRFQLVDRKSKTFVFRLNSVGEVKHILSHGPWSPCDGFMLVAAMPEDGLWSSADLSSVELWVKVHGVPLELLTDEAAVQMANRVGKFVSADKVRRNGILVNSFLRFRTRINISLPLVPGVSLEGNGKKKHWAFFKFEQLPVFCFKCGVIGHMEDVCSGRKRVVLVDDGRSVPLFGPWLRDGSRLENEFALLEVEEIQDRIVLEKHDVAQDSAPVSGPHLEAPGVRGIVEGDPESSSKKIGGDAPGLVRNDLLSGGMEGVPRQRSDTAFTVAYNDYVELPFPSQHVAHVAKNFQENLGPVRFGASLKNDDMPLKRNKSTYQLKKSKMVGPNGIPKTPVFRFSNRDLDSKSGGKRKKTCRDDFTGESTGNDCIAVVENHRVKDVFGAGSAILPGDVESGDGDSTFSNKKLCRAKDNLATEILQCSTQSEGIGGASGDLAVESAPARIDDISKVGLSCADKSAITVRFANILNKPAWNGIFVYGPPVRGDRVSSMSDPWVLLGDLNSLLNQSEKFGGSLVSSGESHSLADFLMLSGGVDIGCIGNFFTWSNKRSLPYLIKERLDRVIGAPEWVINFPKAGVKALSIRASDHAPLVLDLLFDQENVHRPFRFLDAWTRDPSCFDVVRNAWNLAVRGVKSFQLVSRIANTRKMLAKWNQEYFGFCKEKLSALENFEVRDSIQSLLGFRSLTPADKFLGNPISFSKNSSRDFQFVVDKILHHADQDRLIWRDATDGSFSVKQAYLSLIKPRLELVNPLWSKIWKAPLQERVKFFLWKVGMNILPCGTRIQAIFGTTRRCVLCNDAEDSLLHLFFHCPFARACWFSSHYCFHSDQVLLNSSADIVSWMLNPPSGVVPIRSDAVRFTQFVALLCYSLWETRNRAFHDGSLPRPMAVLAKTVKLVEELRQTLVINSESVLEDLGECRAIPHEPRDFNFYVDAAVRGNEAFLAVVVFDRNGDFVDALSAKAAVNSALEAECLALCHAFSLCSSWGCVEANFFSDCLQLVSALNKNIIPTFFCGPWVCVLAASFG
ncbi:hypothetical protein F8388_020799 [Cannabis sativa]|uniref:CCHC-type domain-containing protein n=1 Tax=Cannabis sativa TaxID=3483 RepID=A0A7J6EUH4_CANSA|nr:hypothetical protein G4B88_007161 [Cannabis sativa]KAF4363229.1 hypothetical protein F8388_020799 [Cannabis sativa]